MSEVREPNIPVQGSRGNTYDGKFAEWRYFRVRPTRIDIGGTSEVAYPYMSFATGSNVEHDPLGGKTV